MLDEHAAGALPVGRIAAGAEAFVRAIGRGSPSLQEVFSAYAALCKDHFWKENDILYPLALQVLARGEEAVVAGIEEVEASLGQGTRAKSTASRRCSRVGRAGGPLPRALPRRARRDPEHAPRGALLRRPRGHGPLLRPRARREIFGRTRGAIGTECGTATRGRACTWSRPSWPTSRRGGATSPSSGSTSAPRRSRPVPATCRCGTRRANTWAVDGPGRHRHPRAAGQKRLLDG